MTNIIIRRLPSGGLSRVGIESGTTLDAVVASEGLSGLTITVNGESVAPGAYAGFMLSGGERINASKSVKGA